MSLAFRQVNGLHPFNESGQYFGYITFAAQ